MAKMAADNPAIYQKSANYYDSMGTIGAVSRQVEILRMTLDLNELEANGRNTVFNNVCSTTIYTKKKLLLFLVFY